MSLRPVCIFVIIILMISVLSQAEGYERNDPVFVDIPSRSNGPIFIENNTSLIHNASEYGWNGSGSLLDPIIISDLIIDAKGSEYGIRIWNTTAHLIMYNCSVFNASIQDQALLYSSLDLFNLSNLTIMECDIFGSDHGIISRNSSFRIEGSSVHDLVYYGLDAMNCRFSLYNSSIYNCSISGIHSEDSWSLDINSTDLHNCQYGIILDSCWDVKISECSVQQSSFHGISIQRSNNVNLTNILLNRSSTGLYLSSSLNVYIEGCRINNSNIGIDSTDCFGIFLENLVISSSDTNVRFERNDDFSIKDSILKDGNIGLYLYGCYDGTLQMNTLLNMTSVGVHINGNRGSLQISNSSYVDCDVSIRSFYSSGISISRVNINRSSNGILSFGSDGISIQKNHISNTKDVSIEIRRSDGPVIKDNWIDGAGQDGIKLSNFNNGELRNNTLHDCYNAMEIDYCDGLLISGNRIERGEVGIVTRGVDESIFSQNRIERTASSGIVIIEGTSNMVTENLLLRTGYFALDLFTCNAISVWNNTFAYNNGANETYRPSKVQASDDRVDNIWSVNGFGNHWTDWLGPDNDDDGIVDMPYRIDGNMNSDQHPLAEPLHHIVPSSPRELTSTSFNTSIHLNWKEPLRDGGSSILGYRIYRSNGTGFVQYHILCADNRSFVDILVEGGVEYSYRLKAFNELGDGPYSHYVVGKADRTRPRIRIDFPSRNQYLNVEDFLMEWTITDEGENVENSSYRIDGDSWVDVGANTSAFVSVQGNGPHHIEVRAFDSNLNWNITRVDIMIDLTLPELEIITPVNGSSTNKTSVSFEWNATDRYSDIDHYEIRWDQISWISKGQNTGTVINGLSPGEHTLYAKAVDLAGNTAISMVKFTIDTDEPVIDIVSPIEGLSTNNTEINIKWIASDPSSENLSFLISVDGGTREKSDSASSYLVNIEQEGNHTIEVMAMDPAGNHRTDMVNLSLDTTPPRILDFGPRPDTIAETTDDIFVVFNEDIDVNDVQFVLLGELSFLNWYGNKVFLSLDGELEPGRKYKVRVSGKDVAGNQMEQFLWSFETNASAIVRGNFMDDQNRPIAGITVTIGSDHSTRTDRNGYFEMVIPPGQLLMTAEKEGFEPCTRTLNVEPGEIMELGSIKIMEKVYLSRVIGRVVDDGGGPILGVIINSNTGPSDTTGDDGTFQLELSPGEHELTFIRENYKTIKVPVQVNESKEVDLGDIEMEAVKEENGGEGIDIFQIQIAIFVLILLIGALFLFFMRRRSTPDTLEE